MLQLDDSKFSYFVEERTWEGSLLTGLVFEENIK